MKIIIASEDYDFLTKINEYLKPFLKDIEKVFFTTTANETNQIATKNNFNENDIIFLEVSFQNEENPRIGEIYAASFMLKSINVFLVDGSPKIFDDIILNVEAILDQEYHTSMYKIFPQPRFFYLPKKYGEQKYNFSNFEKFIQSTIAQILLNKR